MKSFIVTITLLAAVSAAAAAQRVPELLYTRSSGGYSAIGGGFGNFTLNCDVGCSGDQMSASDLNLVFGRQFSARWRLEFGAHFQRNGSTSSDFFTASGGVGVFLVGNLFVRGGATYNRVSVEDTNATFEASGGPGFTVGAGYELFIGQRTALTPYVNFTSVNFSTIDVTAPNAVNGTTAGDVRALNFGLTIGRSPRQVGICVNQDGLRVRDSGATHQQFVQCLADVALWLQQQGRSK